MKFISKLFVTLFGIGFIPFAPGTIASIFTVLVWYYFIKFFPIYIFVIVVISFIVISFLLINIYIEDHKSNDPKEVVIDEFIGQSLPLMFLNQNSDLYLILFTFVLFRIFDIFKIYPINVVEKFRSSLGVIADDIVAGIYVIIFVMLYQIISP
tara:strand:+ start:1080 stop:1538 length:459 start_codon:yes stop_codon:yes gene_type:complete